jgi:hypothetical protein
MEEPRIPDRSAEPALQASLDHGPKATKAANSDEVAQGAADEKRDDEGNLILPVETEGERPANAQKGEEMTGVPESSEELSDI